MIKYTNNYNRHNFFTVLIIKLISAMNLMYRYVYLYCEIYLGYIIFCLYHINIIKCML